MSLLIKQIISTEEITVFENLRLCMNKQTKQCYKQIQLGVIPKITEEQAVQQIGNYLVTESLFLATAESCTGGGVASAITDVPGSSQWFDRGFITYSNESKVEMLDVSRDSLSKYGAVSEQVAAEMAAGTLINSRASYAISVTGIAGPGGGTEQKPVGTVCFGWAKRNSTVFAGTVCLSGDRRQIRYQSVRYALGGLLERYFNSNLI